MNGVGDRYKPQKRTRKTGTVKRVALSDDAKRAYEALLETRAEKEKAYGRFLDPNNKTR